MKCPNCGAEMSDALNGFWDCSACLLCGAAQTIEALSRRLSPEGVLAEAERLLRVNETMDALFKRAEAYAKLVANNPKRLDSSGGG